MKKLLLITVLLVIITTKSSAQEKKVIELKKIEFNQFKIKVNEELDVNLRFNLELEDNYSVLIYNSRKSIVLSRKNCKVGENQITFTMDEGEQYTVKFINKNGKNLVSTTLAEN